MKTSTTSSDSQKLFVIIPVYNDWENTRQLLPELDQALGSWSGNIEVILVNDGSTFPHPKDIAPPENQNIDKIQILNLMCNLGHQRAIALGLSILPQQNIHPDDLVLIMDGDGEDRPGDVPNLLENLSSKPEASVVFAGRQRRTETLFFRAGYQAYRVLHWVLTGQDVRFGNFSVIRASAAEALTYQSALWNHYAAAVIRARIPFVICPTERGHRYFGKSKLNAPQLVAHGFGALSVFFDVVCARVSAIATITLAVFSSLLLILCWQNLISFAHVFISLGLATLLTLILILQVISLVSLRSSASFIVAKDASRFVKDLSVLSHPGSNRI